MLTVKIWTVIMLTVMKENKLLSHENLHFYNAVTFGLIKVDILKWKSALRSLIIFFFLADMKVNIKPLNKNYKFQYRNKSRRYDMVAMKY